MKIILTNGAPFCGKDTLVNKLLAITEDSVYMRFKDPLYKRFSERHNLPFDEVVKLCSGSGKDQPKEFLDGKTPRQELIDISENEIKVKRGPDGVALEIIDMILDTPEHGRKTFIFPDGGFEIERECLTKLLKRYGLTNLYVIRIVRDGKTFESVNDSRSYLENPDLIIYNNVDESDLPEEQRGQHMLNQYLDWLNK